MQALVNVSEDFQAFQSLVQKKVSSPLKQSKKSQVPLLITVFCHGKGPWGKGCFLQCQRTIYLPDYSDIWERNQCKKLKEYSFLIWRPYFSLAYTHSLKHNKVADV